jgi:hypothetical protein
METKFYTYSQNNSGGYFELNKKDGIAEYVIIEAKNAKQAHNTASDLFASYSNYCECCGERWSYYADDEDGRDEPTIYSEPARKQIEENMAKKSSFRTSAAIHHYNGDVEWIGKEPEEDE